MDTKIVLAPIKGYTDPIWRSCYFRNFKGIDKVVTPFLLLSEANRARNSYFPQFLPELGSSIEVVPQFLVKNHKTLLYASNIMADMGIKEFNLNMGCPAPGIYKKGRGSGLLENLDDTRILLDGIVGKIKGNFTVKIRTGITDNSLIEPIIELLNDYPINEVIVHPRYARQLYNGKPDLKAFSYVYNNSKNPVSYNGDIKTLDDYLRLKKLYPMVSSWMIGRGILQDPFLPNTIKNSKEVSTTYRNKILYNFIMELSGIFENNYKKKGIIINRLKSFLVYIAAYYNGSEEFITRVKRGKTLTQILDIIALN